MTLAVDPDISVSQAFAAIAAEIVHARAHNWGRYSGYSRGKYELIVQSASFILCRRFGIEREAPDLSGLAERNESKDAEARLDFL